MANPPSNYVNFGDLYDMYSQTREQEAAQRAQEEAQAQAAIDQAITELQQNKELQGQIQSGQRVNYADTKTYSDLMEQQNQAQKRAQEQLARAPWEQSLGLGPQAGEQPKSPWDQLSSELGSLQQKADTTADWYKGKGEYQSYQQQLDAYNKYQQEMANYKSHMDELSALKNAGNVQGYEEKLREYFPDQYAAWNKAGRASLDAYVAQNGGIGSGWYYTPEGQQYSGVFNFQPKNTAVEVQNPGEQGSYSGGYTPGSSLVPAPAPGQQQTANKTQQGKKKSYTSALF